MEIREIGVANLRIPPTNIFNVDVAPPVVYSIPVPVTVQLGVPIIEMPGCVEDHRDGDEQLTVDDGNTQLYCYRNRYRINNRWCYIYIKDVRRRNPKISNTYCLSNTRTCDGAIG